MSFRGWPPEALAFLTELEANNDADWFKARRGDYEAHLADPARALGADLARLGAAKTFRPFNDQRFHARPPIKEHVGLALGFDGGQGYYVELSLDGLLVAAGMYSPTPDQVSRWRAAVDAPRKAAGLTRALSVAHEAGLALAEPDLVRTPRGFDADHPRGDLLRHRRVVVSRRFGTAKWLHGPAAGRRIEGLLESAQPLVDWLRAHVGPPQSG